MAWRTLGASVILLVWLQVVGYVGMKAAHDDGGFGTRMLYGVMWSAGLAVLLTVGFALQSLIGGRS